MYLKKFRFNIAFTILCRSYLLRADFVKMEGLKNQLHNIIFFDLLGKFKCWVLQEVGQD
jgi:hypothetical protein